MYISGCMLGKLSFTNNTRTVRRTHWRVSAASDRKKLLRSRESASMVSIVADVCRKTTFSFLYIHHPKSKAFRFTLLYWVYSWNCGGVYRTLSFRYTKLSAMCAIERVVCVCVCKLHVFGLIDGRADDRLVEKREQGKRKYQNIGLERHKGMRTASHCHYTSTHIHINKSIDSHMFALIKC